jgi:DNA-binding GntR family transcriptional regulator
MEAPPVLVWPVGRAEMLYERFKQCIIDRQWLPGQQLNIDRLAREYNVSITPVREALARLAADKLVVATQHRGYTVAPPPSTARMAELFAVRLLLEPPAARCRLAYRPT